MAQTTIGELLRRHRRRANLTQKDLAEAINCNHSLVSRVETGEQFPSQEYIERFMGITALELADTDREEIRAVYQQDRQARRSPLTEGAMLPGGALSDQTPQPLEDPPQLQTEQHLEDRGKAIETNEPILSVEPDAQVAPPTRYNRQRGLIGVLVAAILLAVIFLAWLVGKDRLMLLLQTPTPAPLDLAVDECQLLSLNPQTGQLITTSSQSPSYITVWAGQPVTVTCWVRNEMSQAITIPNLVASARGPNANTADWQAPKFDFPHALFVTLQPGEVFIYSQTRTFPLPGDYYFVEMTKQDAQGYWGGLTPSPRLWFRVKDSQ